jgi:hypothetical protein
MQLLAQCAHTPASIKSLTKSMRLALEIGAHEAIERRAAEGELGKLIEDWKAAEEIASIADNLLVPRQVEGMLHYLRSKTRQDSSNSTSLDPESAKRAEQEST